MLGGDGAHVVCDGALSSPRTGVAIPTILGISLHAFMYSFLPAYFSQGPRMAGMLSSRLPLTAPCGF